MIILCLIEKESNVSAMEGRKGRKVRVGGGEGGWREREEEEKERDHLLKS